jgi:hypothetical protein
VSDPRDHASARLPSPACQAVSRTDASTTRECDVEGAGSRLPGPDQNGRARRQSRRRTRQASPPAACLSLSKYGQRRRFHASFTLIRKKLRVTLCFRTPPLSARTLCGRDRGYADTCAKSGQGLAELCEQVSAAPPSWPKPGGIVLAQCLRYIRGPVLSDEHSDTDSGLRRRGGYMRSRLARDQAPFRVCHEPVVGPAKCGVSDSLLSRRDCFEEFSIDGFHQRRV